MLKRQLWALAAAVLVAGVAAGQVRGFHRDEPGRASGLAWPESKAKADDAAGKPEEDAPKDPLESLDLRHRVSQLMLVTLNGSTGLSNDDLRVLNHYTPGGVLLPAMVRPADVRDLVERLRAVPGDAGVAIPLLVGTNLYDLPKGRNAPNEFFGQLPSLLSVAAANDPESTARMGEMVAKQLKAMGINLNLGPSLELAPNLPGVRGSLDCLGSNPAFAAEAGGTIVKALLDNGIVAVPMGFPGGGGNRRAKEPAVLVTPRALLETQDLLPYRKAVELEVPAIHVGNTYVPTLERGKVPASLSPAVMRDLLREKMGFKGVIIAGPMDTNDVALAMDPSKAALESLKAGADMILWNGGSSRVLKTVDEIVTAVNEGRLSQEVIDGALRRVMALKEKQGLAARALPDAKEADKLERDKNAADAVYAIERRAITLVQNRDNILPLRNESMPVGITGEVGVEELHEALKEYIKYVVMQPIRSAKHSGRILDFEISRLTSHPRGLKTAVCVFTNNGETASKAELVRELQKAKMRVVVILLGYPGNLQAFADADAILLAYCTEKAYVQTLRAMADVLVGEAPVSAVPFQREVKVKVNEPGAFSPLDVVRTPAGTLPVTLDERYKAGLFVPYDPADTLKKVVWDFGDGDKSKDFVSKHTYAAPGRYPVTLTVTDKRGQTSQHTFDVVAE